MQIVEQREGGTAVITLAGALDGSGAPSLAERALALCETGVAALLIDMTAVPYLTSAGFRALIMIRRRCEEGPIAMALCGLGEVVQDLFETGGLLGRFDIHPDRASALAAIAAGKT